MPWFQKRNALGGTAQDILAKRSPVVSRRQLSWSIPIMAQRLDRSKYFALYALLHYALRHPKACRQWIGALTLLLGREGVCRDR